MTPYQEHILTLLRAMGPPRHIPKGRGRTEEELEDFGWRRIYRHIVWPGCNRKLPPRTAKRKPANPSKWCRVRMPTPPEKRKRQRVEDVIKRAVKRGAWKLLATESMDDGDTRYLIEANKGTFYIHKSSYEDVPAVQPGSA